MARAAGDYVAPLDADDLWHPQKIAKQVEAALAAPEPPGFVYCWSRDIDEQGLVWRDGERYAIEGAAFQQLVYVNFVGNGSALLLSRAAALAVGGYDARLRSARLEGCEDILLQLQVARRHPVALVPEYLVGYRRRDGAMSGDPRHMYESWKAAARIVRSAGPMPGDVMRQNRARRCLDLAEALAWRGDVAGCIKRLVAACWLDPVRSTLFLAGRLGRRLAGHSTGRRHPAGIRFDNVAAGTAVRELAAGDGWLAGVRAIDRSRLRRLARRDRRLHVETARREAGADPRPVPRLAGQGNAA